MKTQIVTVKCPLCGRDMDITLYKNSDPIFSDYHFGNSRDCPGCGLNVHITIDGNEKEVLSGE